MITEREGKGLDIALFVSLGVQRGSEARAPETG